MTTNQLHQHNPEIIKILKGCKKMMFKDLDGCGNMWLCSSCKSILKGILIAQTNEVSEIKKDMEWLHHSTLGLKKKDDVFTFKTLLRISDNLEIKQQRLEALKTSNADIKEKIK